MPKFRELSDEAQEKAIRDWRDAGLAFEDNDASELTHEFQSFLEEKGVYSSKDRWVFWNLGYCQGDGVCFEGNVDTDILFKQKGFRGFKGLKGIVSVRISNQDSKYCHWNSMTVEVHTDFSYESLMREDDLSELRNFEWKQRALERNPQKPGVLDWSPDGGDELPRRIQRAKERAQEKEKRLEGLIPDLEKAVSEWAKDLSKELEKIGYEEIEYRRSADYIAEILDINEYDFDEDGDRK